MSRRGRPRELPALLPRLDPAVVTDPALEGVQLQSQRVIVTEARRQRRLEKQRSAARAQAEQRGRRQIEELARACDHAKRTVAKAAAREKLDISEADMRKLCRVSGYGKKRPRLTDGDHRVIQELAGEESQRAIAQRLGTTQSTVSRHLHRSGREAEHRGRKCFLTKNMVFAAARFQFLCKTTSLAHTAAFVKLMFGITISTKTMSNYLKNVAGFRLGDFRRFPRDCNSLRAIEERYTYATTMPAKHGQNTLYEAVYYDEMKLSRMTQRKAWSIGGWIPTVLDEFYSKHPEHVSLLLAASPSFWCVAFRDR